MYLVCLSSCEDVDLAGTRRAVRDLRLAGQRRIHFSSESNRRRRWILRETSRLEVSSTVFHTTEHDERTARRKVLQTAARHAIATGVQDLTIESRRGQDDLDRATLFDVVGRGAKMRYRRVVPHDEPLLWIPDALAWAYGRSGECRRLLDRLGLVDDVQVDPGA